MTISLAQAIIIGLFSGICLAGQMLGIYTNRSLVLSLGIGIILGDIPTALAMGAIGEMAFLGFGVSICGAAPPNQLGPGVIGTLLAITMKNSGVTVEQALALSFPFAVAVQFLVTLSYTLSTPAGAWMNKELKKGHFLRFKILAHSCVIMLFIFGFLVGFGSAVSMPTVKYIISLIPKWLMQGITVAGGMLPTAGFAIVMDKLTNGEKKYLAYVILGYVCMSYFKLPILGLAFVGIIFAIYDYFSRQARNKAIEEAVSAATENNLAQEIK